MSKANQSTCWAFGLGIKSKSVVYIVRASSFVREEGRGGIPTFNVTFCMNTKQRDVTSIENVEPLPIVNHQTNPIFSLHCIGYNGVPFNSTSTFVRFLSLGYAYLTFSVKVISDARQ